MSDVPMIHPPARGWRFRFGAIALIALAFTVPTGFWVAQCMQDERPTKSPSAATSSPFDSGSISVGGVPLFASWPKDQQPEVVFVLTGQTFGYMSPCGCSRPQKGGLERRANLMMALRGKGWPLVPLDLGDVAAPRKIIEQDLLKYKYTMQSLADMGYAAVGLGEYDMNQQLWQLLAQYTLQKPDAAPILLAANLVGLDDKGNVIPREKQFAGAGKRPMIEALEIVTRDPKLKKDHIPVSVTSVIGPMISEKLRKIDSQFGYLSNAEVLKAVVDSTKKLEKQPAINVLLYAGNKEEATKAANVFPEFQVVVCQIEESEPPQFPSLVNDGKTFIIQVGHKGQNVGVLGVFKTATGYELKYQLVPLGEEFLTPEGEEAAAASKQLQLLEQYTSDVKKQNLLAKFTEKPLPHPAQLQNPTVNLSFVGSERCQKCHADEYKVWKQSKHGHAMEALEKYATRPSLRQFDGECVVCHSVGFGYQTGYRNATDTPNLAHVGCESCHGPGSGHSESPTNKDLLAALSSWKTNPADRLPPLETLKQLAAVKPGEPAPIRLQAKEQQIMTAVRGACMKCHDPENDPKFELEKYIPQMWHSGLRNAGLPPGVK